MQEPEIARNRLSYLWLLPVIALGIGLWLAWSRLSQIGPIIQIAFTSAEGLEAGKTKIRYKDLEVGTVTSIDLSNDLKQIIVTAQMLRTAEPLLKKDSQFWIVKPQISASGITGLGTIVSGNYITVSPGKDEDRANHFTGLDEAPQIQSTEEGLRVRLLTNDARGVNVGTAIYYRGIAVGQIEQIRFSEHYDNLYLTAFIHAPYDRLITNNTKFWNVSGINFSMGAEGANLEMQSLEALVRGGITFSTPTTLNTNDTPASPGTVYTLFENERASTERTGFEKEYYVVYFDSTTRGLRQGAPVYFNGMNIGEVIDIRLLYDETANTAVTPVLIALEPDRIDRVNRQEKRDRNLVADLVKHGLQATLENGNLITGDKIITLKQYPDDIRSLRKDTYSNYLVLPSRADSISQLTDDINSIVTTVKKLPLEEIAANTKDATAALKNTLTSPAFRHLDQTLKQLDKTLVSIQKAGDSTDKVLTQLNQQMKTLGKQLEQTLYNIGPESNLTYSLQETLKTVQRSMKSINDVMRKIDDKPNVLIMGE
ncbi:MlaD family protein [uncultured Cardiobacterium sp.]|uniref:PqiB family protein n=1 Tax=uncultured Cardiobacterium sp. TaxID=417619 RepID=UPI0026118465|nr:MlaD family protein [uncultured Cardiobacterium sp.]